jgi:hypothetical protein
MSVSVATSCSFAMCDPMVTIIDSQGNVAKDPVPYRYIYITCTYMYICACQDRIAVFKTGV